MNRLIEYRIERHLRVSGITLIEMMIVVAILTIVASIAIPAYNAYITEARFGTARANMDSMRIVLEDFRLDEGDYGSGTLDEADLANIGWTPDGDGNAFDYFVYATSGNTPNYNIAVIHKSSGAWVRCEDRMDTCCDGIGGTGYNSACP